MKFIGILFSYLCYHDAVFLLLFSPEGLPFLKFVWFWWREYGYVVESFRIDRKDWEFVWVCPQRSHGNGILRGSAEFSFVFFFCWVFPWCLHWVVLLELYITHFILQDSLRKRSEFAVVFWDRILRTNWCEDCGCLLFPSFSSTMLSDSFLTNLNSNFTHEDLSLFCPSSFHQISSWTLW